MEGKKTCIKKKVFHCTLMYMYQKNVCVRAKAPISKCGRKLFRSAEKSVMGQEDAAVEERPVVLEPKTTELKQPAWKSVR